MTIKLYLCYDLHNSIHKMLLLLKNHLNYLKDSIFESFFKEYNRLFLKKDHFHKFPQHLMVQSLSLEEGKIIKNMRNLFRLKKFRLNYTVIKDIRKSFRLEKK